MGDLVRLDGNMAKSKDRSEVETLKGIIRSQKSEIRKLKKELSRKQKREFRYEDLEEKLEEIYLEKEESKSEIKCVKCKSNKINISDLGIRILHICENCGNRESIKK
jgi:alpha-acetolactate decarboxylase